MQLNKCSQLWLRRRPNTFKHLFTLLAVLFLSPLTASSTFTSLHTLPEKQLGSPVVARVYFSNIADLNRLALTLDIWEVQHEAGYLVALLSPSQYSALLQAGYRVEIDPEKTARLDDQSLYLPGQVSGIPGFPCYRTVEETYADLAQIAVEAPDLAQWIDIGDSWEKVTPGGTAGYDIYTLKLTSQVTSGPKPVFYLMAAIHAREYATAELAARFAEYLVDNYGLDPDVTWLLDHYEVHVTPQANPDGRKIAETGVLWRKNTDNDDGCLDSGSWGVDLNRNSSFKWGGVGASLSACNETFRGPSAASEPETQAIENYVRSIFPDQRGPNDDDPAPADATGVFITLHSYGTWVLTPWGWTYLPPPNNTALETLGRKFGYYNRYTVCRSGDPRCIYQTSGTTDDFAYGELGVAAYTFELGTEFFQSCSSFEENILPDNLAALVYAAKASRHPYLDPSGPETIDLALTGESAAPGAAPVLAATADDTRYFSNGWGEEPSQSITAARYSVDAPSWSGADTFPVFAEDGAFDETVEPLTAAIDTTCWLPARHIIFVESQDSSGSWGVPSATFLTVSDEGFQLCLEPTESAAEVMRGASYTYSLTVTNLGVEEDTYDIVVTGNAWTTEASPVQVGPLGSGSKASFTVTVTVPIEAVDGEQDIAILTVTSQGDPSQIVSASLTTTARQAAAFFPLIQK